MVEFAVHVVFHVWGEIAYISRDRAVAHGRFEPRLHEDIAAFANLIRFVMKLERAEIAAHIQPFRKFFRVNRPVQERRLVLVVPGAIDDLRAVR